MSGDTHGSDFESELKRRFGAQSSPSVSLDATSLAMTAGAVSAEREVLGRLLQGAERRYVSLGEVARGGMGRVDRVWDRDLRRELAMKVLLESPSPADDRAVYRFVSEAQITGQLNHPGIVPVHEIGLDAEGRVYFTMRLIRGHTFRDVIDWTWNRRSDWNQQRALRVLLNACDALAYAHSRGVIHRDLKPSNIMVGGFGETYVMDWGLARVLHDSSQTEPEVASSAIAFAPALLQSMAGSVVGTPAYMAPEQARGSIEALSERADVYSMGAMLYHLLTGAPPYTARAETPEPKVILERVRAGPPEPLRNLAPEVAAELIAICERAMDRDPQERYRDMQEMAADLRAYLDQRVVRAYRTGAWAELSTWVRRNRAIAAAASIALFVTLAGLSSILWVTTTKNATITAQTNELKSTNQNLKTERERAQRNFDDMSQLAALKRLRDLQRAADEIWPTLPAQVPRMQAWLDEAQGLVGRRAQFEESLAMLKQRAIAPTSSQDALQFASSTDAWWHESLQELLNELSQLTLENPRAVGTITEMQSRMQRAHSMHERSINEYETEWSEALDAISERYGLTISEQMGLVPLGPDPDSGWWEFWVLDTGEFPERDLETHQLTMTEASGLVLVLLPGAPDFSYAHSIETDEALARRKDPTIAPDTKSSVAIATAKGWERVPLAPFFFSKYEMTQGQWLALTGANPSTHHANAEFCRLDKHSLLCPVDSVSWIECDRMLRRVGLAIPTLVQWQYGARAGTDTPWWIGNEPIGLNAICNIKDRAYRNRFQDPASLHPASTEDDGWACVAPIGQYKANPFGLHDVLGNSYEWCKERMPPSRKFLGHWAPNTGEFIVDEFDPSDRGLEWKSISRGGCFRSGIVDSTVLRFGTSEPAGGLDDTSVRPVRALDD